MSNMAQAKNAYKCENILLIFKHTLEYVASFTEYVCNTCMHILCMHKMST